MAMVVPQFWAEARLQQRAHRKQVTVRRFGWSDLSQEDAQAHAEARVREAFERILSGEKLPRREHKQAYNGAEGLPIREEVVARHGETVISRNGYGALCLNTPNVLFADMDFDDPGPSRRLKRWVRTPLLSAAMVAGVWYGSWWLGIGAFVAALIVADFICRRVHRHFWLKDGGPVQRANERIDAFLLANPEWCFRVYRTPAGLRLLAMHRTFDPGEPAVGECFGALQADTIYALMCARQHCFRARVSPKPWRVGISAHMRPRPGVWPIKPERMPDRERWIAEYERASRGFAACRYERTVRSGVVDPVVDDLRRLHDSLTGAELALPIA
jgi:hypothetical protein